MLGRGYITIGSQTIPNPVDYSVDYENIENVGVSEAGTQLVSVTRLKRRNINITCQVTSMWRDKLLTLAGADSTTLVIMSETINGRLRIKSETLAKNSEYVTLSTGLWTMQLTFIET